MYAATESRALPRADRRWWRLRRPADPRAVLLDHGHILLALIGAAAFVIARPAVADLQAADARAGAAARGVGLSYWLSWYSGISPGDYSILTPTVTAALGVAMSAGLSVLAIALLARPLVAGTVRPRSGAYLVVISAVCNLWAGRVPFSLGAAFSLGALLALRRGRPWTGGALNAVGAMFSPLAPALVLLGLLGPAVSQPARRPDLVRFAVPSLIGLALPTIAFGVPGHMPFAFTTLLWTVGILLAAVCVPLPRHLRVGLVVAVAVVLVLFVVPNGVGANISRYAYLVIPPLVWILSAARTRIVALALLPALSYSGYNIVTDLAEAHHPSAQQSFYTGLRDKLVGLPDLHNHRVEVIDTETHRAANELVPAAYLARGWEDQSDTTVNPIFYSDVPLTAGSYRRWLDGAAVAWVAVPANPAGSGAEEAELVTSGLPYLTQVWHNAQWRLYAVGDPEPIVSPPASLVNADETTMIIDVPAAGAVSFRIRPSRYLELTATDATETKVCLTALTPSSVQAIVPRAGRYELDAHFSVPRMLGSPTC